MNNYPNIKKLRLTHAEIAQAMGYRTVSSFRSSSAHKRIMQGVEEIVGLVLERVKKRI